MIVSFDLRYARNQRSINNEFQYQWQLYQIDQVFGSDLGRINQNTNDGIFQ